MTPQRFVQISDEFTELVRAYREGLLSREAAVLKLEKLVEAANDEGLVLKWSANDLDTFVEDGDEKSWLEDNPQDSW
jgi:hypothetical protein